MRKRVGEGVRSLLGRENSICNGNFLFALIVCFLMFLRWHMLHRTCILKTLLWLQCGKWIGCEGAVPVTAERLSGGYLRNDS